MMRAMVLDTPGHVEAFPLRLKEVPIPRPRKGELLVKVSVCGVCRTDLHILEGDLPPRRLPIIPGHQIVGVVEELGEQCARFSKGTRVGIPWLRHTCGRCGFCRSCRENLCDQSSYTGYDENGGYAEYAVVPEDFAYALPNALSDERAAPLLCAGIIGYRALKLSELPAGGRLGIFGFGSSAHIVMQIAIARGAGVYVFTRNERHRALAKELGAGWSGSAETPSPLPLDSAIVFAPAGPLVPVALRNLKRGGTAALAGIYMTDIPAMSYERHLFHEKKLVSVESNTRSDGEELLEEAVRLNVRPKTEAYPLEKANEALLLLRKSELEGTGLLMP